MPDLVLLRHGESEWNREGRFTGWVDVDLSDKGVDEARVGGLEMLTAGVLPDVVHTSLLTRAIRTAEIALAEMSRSWIPVRRSWRLNERHYGRLQGLSKSDTREEFGDEQFRMWRRSFDVPPPPLDEGSDMAPRLDARYASVPPDLLPRTECLRDVIVRMLPYWADALAPDLRAGHVVLVAAHGNSLRALVKHLDGVADDAIVGVDIPTGIPLVYELDADLRRVKSRYLGDPVLVAAATAAVAAQGSTPGAGVNP